MSGRRFAQPILISALALLAWTSCPSAMEPDRDGYRLATTPRGFRFPRDHASHPEYRTEWWYYTGHLRARGRSFGYQITFFRVGVRRTWEASRSAWAPHTVYFAHLALTDEAHGAFRHEQIASRPALGMAGADTARYHVWLDDASVALAPDGVTHRLHARASSFAVDLDLRPMKRVVAHGDHGLSQKAAGAGHATHYYSFTRLATSGTLTVGRMRWPVNGLSWMDHEYGTNQLTRAQVGWDWFSVQLDDSRELMLYLMRHRGGGLDSVSGGTLVEPDGTSYRLGLRDVEVRATGTWTSPRSKATYPQGWRIRLPREALELTIAPTVQDQELDARSGGVTYWEGSVLVLGTHRGRRLRGVGYVELTGYAGAVPGF